MNDNNEKVMSALARIKPVRFEISVEVYFRRVLYRINLICRTLINQAPF